MALGEKWAHGRDNYEVEVMDLSGLSDVAGEKVGVKMT